jgi:hypothetical protein
VPAHTFLLIAHPDLPSQAIKSVGVSLDFQEPDWVALTYVVHGRIDQLALQTQGNYARRDRLWEHTCFEMFSRNTDYQAYEELNFSPSTDWAAYEFSAYRAGMLETHAMSPEISLSRDGDVLTLKARGALAEGSGPWQIALAAVIEELDGTKSYWALAHPPGKPDFHHPTCFTITLAPPEVT